MPACPRGHESDESDWCDVCGSPIGASPSPAPAPTPGCGVCAAPMSGRFCERCGHDRTAPAVPAAPPAVPEPGVPEPGVPAPGPAATWRAVARADRVWFEEVGAQQAVGSASPEFPRFAPERHYVLAAGRVTVGRRSRTRGTAPDIDLAGFDPAVSAAHALLVAGPDGWNLVDLGSTNGTTLGVADGPIPPHVPVPLADGAVVRLGAWTTLTLTST